ncbi:MAG: ABC transporter ATP-binding protein [Acidimicrobiia bacterium]|nr:ABC transporter ATP-binding protein [Acidimicrobiia bacterium]
MDDNGDIAVAIRGLTKRFPGVLANEAVDLTVRRGEIHALLGENGAGKSTLMSCLVGLYSPDEGHIEVATAGRSLRQVDIHSPRAASRLGIGMVYQHFKLVPNQTVAENIILGAEGVPFVPKMRDVEQAVGALADKYGLHVDPSALIWQLSVGLRQRVEILKLLYRGAEILILDEPTAVLTPQEADALGATLRGLADDGKAIIFISHKLGEVLAFSDRITVLRDGKNVATLATKDADKPGLAELMVGRPVLFRADRDAREPGEVVLSCDGVSANDDRGIRALSDVTFSVRSGEIVGVAGVTGNGQAELAEVVTGLRKPTKGKVALHGEDVTGKSARRFIDRGVAHVPADRLGMGLAGDLPLTDNFIMKRYRRAPVSAGPFIDSSAVADLSRTYVDRFRVLTPSIKTLARNLSGGNQQKAILAREIDAGDRAEGIPFIVAAYPTRGLDVGAIETVRSALLEERLDGAAVLLLSEDLDELFVLSDRLIVLHDGEVMGIVASADATKERIGLMMAGEAT